jgi:hypothetical protein
VKIQTLAALALTSLFACTVGCGLIPGLGGDGSGGSSSSSAGGSTSSIPTGVDCGTDPNTGAVLCLGNTLCTGITVDSSVFPGCGFRITGEVVDIECSCNGYLCPLGATTCADATTKLGSENLGIVCEALSTNGCVQGTAPAASTAAASSSGGSSSTCDTECRDECAGEPTCIQNCGC